MLKSNIHVCAWESSLFPTTQKTLTHTHSKREEKSVFNHSATNVFFTCIVEKFQFPKYTKLLRFREVHENFIWLDPNSFLLSSILQVRKARTKVCKGYIMWLSIFCNHWKLIIHLFSNQILHKINFKWY